MHPKYKTYWEYQIISYSGKHYQFLSTLHLAVPCSYNPSFRAPLSAGGQYLSLDLCLWMAPQSKPVGATCTWELAQHFADLESLKSSQESTVTERRMGRHPTEHLCTANSDTWNFISHWNQSGFDSLGFVAAGYWIYATFSLFTIAIVYSCITVKGKEKYFVGKQWFKGINLPLMSMDMDSEWSLLDHTLINLV